MGVGVGSGRVDEVPVPALVPLQVLSAGSIITPFICLPPPLPSHHLACVSCVRALLCCCMSSTTKPRPEKQPERQASVAWMGGWVSMFERAMAASEALKQAAGALHWLSRHVH